MAYKAMRRKVMQEKHDKQLRETAAKVYKVIGLELPPEEQVEQMEPRMHGGCELVTTFTPTPKGPKLNVVHGPNAVDNDMMYLPREVVGAPLLGAGFRAKVAAELGEEAGMEVDAEFDGVEARPYFYPRREKKKGGGIKKKRRKAKGLKGSRKGRKVAMETE